MKDQGLVSVIIPTHNRARLLPRAIGSVLQQSYRNIELIIVDDASDDNTPGVIAEHVSADNRVMAISNSTNAGQFYSLNAGIEKSRGDFVMFLDDDCEYLPQKVAQEIALMGSLSPMPSIIYSNMWVGERCSATMLPAGLKNKLLTPEDIFSCRYSFLDQGTWLCQRSVVRSLKGFDCSLAVYNDIDFMMRAILCGERIYFLNIPLSIKHKTKGTSTVSLSYVKHKEQFLNKYVEVLNRHRKYLARLYYGLGKDLLILGDVQKARLYFWRAFLSRPLKVKYFRKALFPVRRGRA